ncbi:hypothetical protein [Rufibacter sp. LB8]|uniref:hypothetical protein n=1 Tax=Rufibacter sp. LB8 TaxID=2777781 RepID=UPI00178C6DF5|nr:hypothetical protein [Rufibacter sp. LB8]
MVQIAQNFFYELAVDPVKNRIYFKVFGSWSKEKDVPLYVEHWKQALALVKPGFSLLSDIREGREYGVGVRALHLRVQKMIVAAGLSQVAEVHTLNEPASEQAIDLAHESNLPLNIFDSLEDAEAWLAEVS